MNNNQTYSFIGIPIKSVYKSDNFKVYAMEVNHDKYPMVEHNKYGSVSICGDISDLILDTKYEVTAIAEQTKYGVSYRVQNIRRSMPTTMSESKAFLYEILSKNQAEVLFKNYPNIIELIKNGEDNKVDLNKLNGIGEYTFGVIKRKIIENFKLADLVAEFKGIMTISMLRRIYDKYPDINKLREKLEDEPYSTLTKISGVGFKKADAIVLDLQKENVIDFGYNIKQSIDRCLACIVFLLQENENDGNTKMNLADLRKQCIEMVPECMPYFAEAIQSDDIYYNKAKMDIALSRTYKKEWYIANTIMNNVSNTYNVWDFDIEKYRSLKDFDLSDEQMLALKNVCNYNISILNGPAGCVDCDTEFFNGTEWKRIADYKDGDKVLQYNEDGTANLVKPLAYIKQPADHLWHFKTKNGLNQCLSDNHTCVYETRWGVRKKEQFAKIRQKQNESGFTGKFITTFEYSGSGIDLSDDEIRLMVAVFADGCYINNKKNNYVRMHLKKERKIQRIISILEKCGYKYRISATNYGYTDILFHTPFYAKHFPKEWYCCDKHQFEIIADEVLYWDGTFSSRKRYMTSDKSDADFVQFAFAVAGYRGAIEFENRAGEVKVINGKEYIRKTNMYSVSKTTRNMPSMSYETRKNRNFGKTQINKYKTKDGYEYCFTVPSHMLVLRRGDRIFVTGNCGKSSSMKALINMLEDNGKSFVLLGPTGKSAKVLSNFTNKRASTIHRGLMYSPRDGWGYNNDNKVSCDIVIVDESSMIDVNLFSHLIDAIDFTQTKLLLIGDNAQLPSVGCGNLFHDLIESKVVPSATLTKVHRYGEGGILTVATDTRFCKPYLDKTMRGKATWFGSNRDYVFRDIEPEKMINTAVSIYKKLLDDGENIEDIQIITPKNVGDYGTVALNNMVQKAVNKNYGSETCMKVGETTYYKDDIVIQKHNNYKAFMCDTSHNIIYDENDRPETVFVANGESAIVRYACNSYVVLNFDGVLVKYEKPDMIDIGLGYAITTHKSQGSGIKNVILCSPKSDIWMLNSNLLYVGVTRSIKRCFHIGSINTVNMAIKKKANLKRSTFLQEMLLENS